MDLLRRSLLILGLLALGPVPGVAQPETITVASTTSTEQSGLFQWLLPRFTEASGIAVKVVALGSGQALNTARRGDADVVLVHDRAAEEAFVAEGFGVKRLSLMYNDFVIVGPASDPAGIAGRGVIEALKGIAAARASFISRGDRSGTHAAELRYWKEAGLDLGSVRGEWYREVGQGMGPALNTAAAADAYLLADRGTWLSFKNRGPLKILVEGDRRLFNQYGLMLVNPEKHPHVRARAGQAFIDWLVSAPGQSAIAGYRIGGEQLFFPNAGVPGGL
ncbi:substrate-binding domain-containing protein [Methylobacterium iners]|uniref:Tungstate-binding protein TupA n=1 Tax=Methylobacterium iners TaxID=418707 RepID=A0ABQ4RZY8_9HYPH|nr:substrate-binding domain-containing protein [Methylobacterium iners]GJD95127.1 Tungstate-binding protein TupA [Methylobacterium iners]